MMHTLAASRRVRMEAAVRSGSRRRGGSGDALVRVMRARRRTCDGESGGGD